MAPLAYQKISAYLAEHSHTWLVTGAAGFIGSHLVERLLQLKQRVIGLDNFSTGHARNLQLVLDNFSKEAATLFTFIEGDIRDATVCERAIQRCDFVLHQAALGSVPRSLKDPVTSHAVNVDGFLNVLIAAQKMAVQRFVYASSSSVYGDSPLLPKQESHMGKPLSPYAVTKMSNELYASVFEHCYGVQTIGLRYFNVFGARQDPEGPYAAVIPLWVKKLLANEPVYINGDGKTTRDFCYIDNVVQMNLLAALVDNPEAIGKVYNVAVGEQTTLNRLFVEIAKLLGKDDIQPEYREFRAGDIRHSLADISRAQNLLGYVPTHQVTDGLKIAMQWYKHRSVFVTAAGVVE